MQGDEDAEEPEAPEDEPDEPIDAASAKPPPKPAPAEPERQLSKKELKKKELEDMDAVLAELGIAVAPVRGLARAASCRQLGAMRMHDMPAMRLRRPTRGATPVATTAPRAAR